MNIAHTRNYAIIAAAVLVAALLAGVNSAYAQQEQTTGQGERVVAFVGSIVALVGTASAIFIAIYNQLKTKGIVKEGQNKILDEVYNSAKGIKGTDFWTLENQRKLVTVVDAIGAIVPQVNEELQKRGTSIDNLKDELNKDQAELEKIHGSIPPS